MSPETTADPVEHAFDHESLSALASEFADWEGLIRKMEKARSLRSPGSVFGEASRRGEIYQWGIGAASNQPCPKWLIQLSRVACEEEKRRADKTSDQLESEAVALIEQLESSWNVAPLDAATAVIWAAALPGLIRRLKAETWQQIVRVLIQVHSMALEQSPPHAPERLMLGAELGCTLAWRLPKLDSCKRLYRPGLQALDDWCDADEDSINAALTPSNESRLLLASLIRCKRILGPTSKRREKRMVSLGDELATWVAALTTHTGQPAFCSADRNAVRPDLAPYGLLRSATEFDPDVLTPALEAALGKIQSGGRLAWQVSLPEAIHHNQAAKIGVLFPEWDVRRGRTHVDYAGEEVQIELFSGRRQVISGPCQTLVKLEDQEQHPTSEWAEVCEYTDDDVHYLEIEQHWSSDLLIQRQILLVRDDRCVLFADAVMPTPDRKELPGTIDYTLRMKLNPKISAQPEPETRELFLSDDRRRVLVLPLAAGEWQVGPTKSTLRQSEDQHLVLSATGSGACYAPLWFDFQQRRFKRKRTWRQLTVADQLRIVGDDEATGYRVQVGSEQWVVYRSLTTPTCRTFLGKHLLADFFCSRFDPGDGSHEELITVDDYGSDDD